MGSKLSRNIRSTTTLLILALTWDGLAHAAKPSSKLAALIAATQTPGPVTTSPAQLPAAQDTVPAPSARDRLRAAHTVYLAPPKVDPHFAVSGTEAYDAVLDSLNQWGRYRIVSDASHADLVLQLHGQVTEFDTAGTPPDYTPSVYYSSSLALTVADPQNLAPLWEVKVPVQTGFGRKARTLKVATSGQNVVSNLKLAAGDTLTSQDKTALKTISAAKNRAVIILVVSAAAVALAALLSVHFMHKNAADFCQAHGLTPCPGA